MYRILLVDDEGFARQGLRALMDWAAFGFEVCGEAENGEEALQRIGSLQPDLVITDIRMPILDGLELIRRVRESGNTACKFVIISGYNDFKYAQQAIKFNVQDFILKPIDEEELGQALNNAAQQLNKEQALRQGQRNFQVQLALERLLAGQESESGLARTAELLQADPQGSFQCLLAELNGLEAWPDERERQERIREVREFLCSSVAEACGVCGDRGNRTPPALAVPSYEYGPGLCGLLLNGEQLRQIGDSEKFAQWTSRLIRIRFGLDVRYYAGEIAGNLREVPASNRSAGELLQYKFACDDRPLLRPEEARAHRLTYAEIESSLHIRLMEQMEEGDRTGLQTSVSKLFQEFRSKRYAVDAVRNALNLILFGVIRAIRNLHGTEADIRPAESAMQGPAYPMTPAGWELSFRDLVLACSSVMAKLRVNCTRGDIAKIKAYIEAHYRESINLKSIAAKFYMNPVYLGQLFKKTYGEYFNEFLLRLRIAKAKELLRQTDRRIYEIAAAVGFSNADYFVIQFEKVEHCTPSEYRSALLAK